VTRTKSTLARIRRAAATFARPRGTAHGRSSQEAWTYDAAALEIYREAVLLHERLVPYVRAAAASAARSGLPIIRALRFGPAPLP
jgi:alpha-glucosidase (family GH31 glycosyl hydrolase)